jgi:glycosyltransferase involved in cell wall biosynthesis
VVPHGLDLDGYRVRAHAGASPYLAWMGRFVPGKGPLEAIKVARQVGMPLRLAAAHNEYYEKSVRQHVDGRAVKYVGELHGEAKAGFLSEAHALLYPVQYGEPFGLVLVEALASGTPVIATDRGAVPEIVRHEESGWLGDSVESLAAGVDRVANLDRAAIRRYAEAEFSAQRMVEGIESVLRQLVEGGKD